MTTQRTHRRRARLVAVSVLALSALAAACGSSKASGGASSATTAKGGTATTASQVATASGLNTSAKQERILPAKNDALAAAVPEAIRKRGSLIIGVGAAGAGFPPLAFAADDNSTLIGSEPDIAAAVASVLGLKADLQNTSWENMWVGLDSGKYDIAFSNVTVTELRKQKYEFATYRQDNLAFEARKDANWTFTKPEDLAGKTIAVGSGTNQEKILLAYADTVKAAGLKEITVKYFQDNTALYLALESGQIDASFGPNPSAAYHVAVGGKTKLIGEVSGAGATLQGLIAAAAKKDAGLAKPVADALNVIIKSGDYDKILKRWNLAEEAIPASEINPPGLPLTNS